MLPKVKIMSLVIALVFFASGSAKLAGLEFEISAFERWGYPLWFMYITGLLEVTGAITLLIQRVSALAALGLSAVMMGAVATHLIHSEWAMLVVASMILIGTLVRAWLGRVEIASLVKSLI